MDQEEKYIIGLRKARQKKGKAIIPNSMRAKIDQAIQKKDSGMWALVFLIGGFNDLVDFGIIGTIPIFGDVLDIATSAVLIPFMFSLGGMLRIKLTILAVLVSLLEFIPLPVIEILNLWTVALLWGYYKTKQRGELAQNILRKQKKGKVSRRVFVGF